MIRGHRSLFLPLSQKFYYGVGVAARVTHQGNEAGSGKHSNCPVHGRAIVDIADALFDWLARTHLVGYKFQKICRRKMRSPLQPTARQSYRFFGLFAIEQLSHGPQASMRSWECRLCAQIPPLTDCFCPEKRQLRQSVSLRMLSDHSSDDRAKGAGWREDKNRRGKLVSGRATVSVFIPPVHLPLFNHSGFEPNRKPSVDVRFQLRTWISCD